MQCYTLEYHNNKKIIIHYTSLESNNVHTSFCKAFVRTQIPVFVVNKRERIPKRQSNIDNSEKLATYGTQDEEKHNTVCVGHRYMQTNTNNANNVL